MGRHEEEKVLGQTGDYVALHQILKGSLSNRGHIVTVLEEDSECFANLTEGGRELGFYMGPIFCFIHTSML
jgi:hypothetical protein